VQVRTNGRAVSDSEVVTSNVLFLVKYAGPALASGLLVSTLGDDAMARAVVQFAANNVQNHLTVMLLSMQVLSMQAPLNDE
jgi:Na+/H+ antiporter NhaA